MKRNTSENLSDSTAAKHAKFDEILDCTICFKKMKNPKKLPCDHSFCETCVICMKNGDEIVCPMDKKVFPFSSVRSDFKHSQFMERLRMERNETLGGENPTAIICKLCDEFPSIAWCKDCMKELCRTCEKAHDQLRENHEITTIQDRIKSLKASLLDRHKNIDDKITDFHKVIEKLSPDNLHGETSLRASISKLDQCLAAFTRRVEHHKAVINTELMKLQQEFGDARYKADILRIKALSLKSFIESDTVYAAKVIDQRCDEFEREMKPPQTDFMRFSVDVGNSDVEFKVYE